MKNTVNYELNKPKGTDYINIEDLNENADKIDTELKSHADSLDEVSTHLADKANNTDSSRTTTSKTVTGAINELNSNKANLSQVTKTQVGLSNVDNIKQMPITYGDVVATASSITLSGTHVNRVLVCNSTLSRTITVPSNLGIGTQITVIRQNTGTVTFAPASGVTLYSVDSKRAIANRHGSATLVQVATGVWQLFGDLE